MSLGNVIGGFNFRSNLPEIKDMSGLSDTQRMMVKSLKSVVDQEMTNLRNLDQTDLDTDHREGFVFKEGTNLMTQESLIYNPQNEKAEEYCGVGASFSTHKYTDGEHYVYEGNSKYCNGSFTINEKGKVEILRNFSVVA